MGVRHMQGTSAFLEYLKPKEEKRRSKKRCIYHDNGICKCNKAGVYLMKCNSPTFCGYYKENEVITKSRKNKKMKKVKNSVLNQKNNKNKIHINCCVELYDYENDEKIKVILVDRNRIDIDSNRISITSPLGSELVGKDVNENIEFKTDKIRKYKVISWNRVNK